VVNLSTTSYAILGQLALRPWTTYELAAEMRRNLHYFWPRAESLIYLEVKRLAETGLASAEHAYQGRRRRTTYAITLEFEGLLRLLFAPAGTPAQLLAALDKVRADAEELLTLGAAIRGEYLAGRAPFQEHVHVRAHVYDFLVRHAELVRDWAARTAADVGAWDEVAPAERTARALRIFEETPPDRAG
jgi:PadR family transcriptional regulator AphA